MRVRSASTSLSATLLCIALAYSLLLTTIAPFAVTRVEAAPVRKSAPPAALPSSPKKGGRREGELLVRFRENVSNEEKTALVESKGAQRAKGLRGESRIEKLKLQEGQDVDALVAELRLNPAVEAVEPNYLVSKDEAIPDDPRFSEQWALKNTGSTGGQTGSDINVTPAWATTTGLSSTVIAVIDSGIDFSHPDLKNNEWTNQGEKANNRDDDKDGFTDDLHGWDWVKDSGAVVDEQGHGTIVAGIIAAQGNNATGTSGVMWRASLMSLRVLDNTGTGDIANAVEAIDYAVTHGAQVINCSWGTDEESTFLHDAIDRAGKKGVIVVTSAGNSGSDLEVAPYYPASFELPNLISVASTDQFDQLASFSNYGSTHVTVAAPGTDILTTQMGGGYRSVTGTSASAPFVTGVAGLIKTLRPWLTAAGTRAAITDGVRHVDALTGRISTGGVLSASGALDALRGPNNLSQGNGNNGNGNNGGGNGSGHPQMPPPATPGRGTGGNGKDGGFSVDPPPQTTSVPRANLPDLNQTRKAQNSVPKAPRPISADLCPDCVPSDPPSSGGSDPYFATARTRPQNETGKADNGSVDLGSRDFQWGIPIVGLKGRAGLDLALSLVYNSLVWTKQGSTILFNGDRGFPGPGFKLGVPAIEEAYSNEDTGVQAYLMVMPSGERIELKRNGTSYVYESADSSYFKLTNNFTNMVGVAKDGTQYTFNYNYGIYRCTQIKDTNGNYISISYYDDGRINTIVDTLGRTIYFNYDPNNANYLSSITQNWNGVTHTWASFYYGNLYMQASFPGLTVAGPNNANIRVLNFVGLADGTYYTFDYTSFGQVWKINSYAADGHLRNYVGYNLPGSGYLQSSGQSDCPRFTERHEWAENWNGNNDAISYFSVDPNSAGGEQPAWSQVQTPDGTVYKETFATSGWQKGLITQTEVFVGSTRVRLTTTAWTQDDVNASQMMNPRPYDISIYDEAGNRRRKDILYSSYGLPWNVREYAADGTTIIRQTYTDYRFDQVYIDKHILGLISAVHVVGVNGYESKTTYDYDWGSDYWQDLPTTPTQYDATGDNTGRGNLCWVAKWDVTDINNFDKTERSYIHHNRTGMVVRQDDHYGHGINISYTDSFSDGIAHSTYAYPTTVTNDAGYSSTMQYNYDFGAVTRTQDPKGAVQTMEYDAAGRIQRVNTPFNGAYTRWVYNPYGDIDTFTIVQPGSPEYFSVTYFDGAGRLRSKGGDNPGSTGNYYGQFWIYDNMGRLSQFTNTAEMNNLWVPVGDDASGWTWTYQTYDWKGRPLLTTNPDGSTRENSYSGCGCAGGEQVTTRDERGRRKKLTTDVFGRLKQVDELNWDQSVYSTTTYNYNALDQTTQINQAGLIRSFDYDGYGRLWHRTTPEQGTTTYTYNMDDTVNTVTDARGASATYSYNNRHLVTNITYGVPSGVAATASVGFGYDEAGNRTSMTDAFGSVSYVYNTLSQLTSETRIFNNVGSYTLSYDYNLAAKLKSFTNPWGAQVGYTYDATGRVSGITGSGYAGISTYASGMQYRAFGAPKQINYGNGRSLSMQYDSRMRLFHWDVSNVLGYNYSYNNFSENTGRVTYAQNLYDATLDRSYDYDHVGRLQDAHTGSEARGHIIGQGGAQDGPYSQSYRYDQFGNMWYRVGWGGWFGSWLEQGPQFSANRMTTNPATSAAMQYDAAGNLTNDGYQSYQYDATGQQTYASATGLTQWYDGDGLRAAKTENGQTTYYLRSSVLGGQVVAEINSGGGWQRGYVYLGSQLLAIQYGGVYWVHQDPVAKSQRVTDSSGTVVSWIEVDPWGGETSRSANSALQPRKFTSYERDNNGGDEAMMRKYEGRWNRFSEPDPYDGSYSPADPQSLNRYSYTQSDPVNFTDPSGEMDSFCGAEYSYSDCGGGGGFWGGGNFGGHVAEYNREFGGMPPNIVEGLRTQNERVNNDMWGNGYRTNAEIIRDLAFQIGYTIYSDGSIETNFLISIDIFGGSSFTFSGSMWGTNDQWPPQWPRPGRNFGWPEPTPRSAGPPQVTTPEGPVRTTPQRGSPGVRVDPNEVRAPKLDPEDPQIPQNLSRWRLWWLIMMRLFRVFNPGGSFIIAPNPNIFLELERGRRGPPLQS